MGNLLILRSSNRCGCCRLQFLASLGSRLSRWCLDKVGSTWKEFLVGGDVLDIDVHRFDVFFDDFLEAVVTSIFLVLDAIGHVHIVHASVLALHLYVHYHTFEELPSDCEVFRSLRAGPDDEISNRGLFEHVDGRLSTYVFELGMGDSSEVCPEILWDCSFLLDFDDWLVFLLEFEAVLIKVDQWMDFFDDWRETGLHAIVLRAIVAIIIFMREIQSHFDLQQLLFL